MPDLPEPFKHLLTVADAMAHAIEDWSGMPPVVRGAREPLASAVDDCHAWTREQKRSEAFEDHRSNPRTGQGPVSQPPVEAIEALKDWVDHIEGDQGGQVSAS